MIFAFSFDEIFFFVMQIFWKISYTPPMFFFIHVFYRWQRKITWRLDTLNLITCRMSSDRMTVVLIPSPSLGFLWLKNYVVTYVQNVSIERGYLLKTKLAFSTKQLLHPQVHDQSNVICRTYGWKQIWRVYTKIFEKFALRKKNLIKIERKIRQKSIFCKFFITNYIFWCRILIWNVFSFHLIYILPM